MIKSKLKNRNLSQEDVFNLSELFKLMKPRVMSLVIFTCAVDLLMAPIIIPTKDAIIGIISHDPCHPPKPHPSLVGALQELSDRIQTFFLGWVGHGVWQS